MNAQCVIGCMTHKWATQIMVLSQVHHLNKFQMIGLVHFVVYRKKILILLRNSNINKELKNPFNFCVKRIFLDFL